MKKVFIFLGPPGSGKGTQTSRLADKLSIPHIDTGSLLRKNIQDGTELGVIAKGYIDKGQLVPLKVVADVIKDRLSKDDCANGYILDGFPRSVEQAAALKQIMADLGKFSLKDDAMAVYFDIDNEVLIQRLINRRSCPNCATIYNLISNPPKRINSLTAATCPLMPGTLFHCQDAPFSKQATAPCPAPRGFPLSPEKSSGIPGKPYDSLVLFPYRAFLSKIKNTDRTQSIEKRVKILKVFCVKYSYMKRKIETMPDPAGP